MALKKTIRQRDGVMTDYHRIESVRIVTNSNLNVRVLSYIDNKARGEEIDQTLMLPYQQMSMYNLEYEDNISIKDIYDKLKELPEFEGAEDI